MFTPSSKTVWGESWLECKHAHTRRIYHMLYAKSMAQRLERTKIYMQTKKHSRKQKKGKENTKRSSSTAVARRNFLATPMFYAMMSTFWHSAIWDTPLQCTLRWPSTLGTSSIQTRSERDSVYLLGRNNFVAILWLLPYSYCRHIAHAQSYSRLKGITTIRLIKKKKTPNTRKVECQQILC